MEFGATYSLHFCYDVQKFCYKICLCCHIDDISGRDVYKQSLSAALTSQSKGIEVDPVADKASCVGRLLDIVPSSTHFAEENIDFESSAADSGEITHVGINLPFDRGPSELIWAGKGSLVLCLKFELETFCANINAKVNEDESLVGRGCGGGGSHERGGEF